MTGWFFVLPCYAEKNKGNKSEFCCFFVCAPLNKYPRQDIVADLSLMFRRFYIIRARSWNNVLLLFLTHSFALWAQFVNSHPWGMNSVRLVRALENIFVFSWNDWNFFPLIARGNCRVPRNVQMGIGKVVVLASFVRTCLSACSGVFVDKWVKRA